MKSRTLMWIAALTLFAALAVPVRLAAQHTRYKLIDFGPSGVGIPGRPLNNRSTVVFGACGDPDCTVFHSFKWSNGVFTDLGAGLSGGSGPIWISDSGLILSNGSNGAIDPLTGTPEQRGVFFTKDGQVIDIGTLDGGNESFGLAVNNRGEVVGVASDSIPDPFSLFGFGTETRAILWQKGVMQDLGTLGGPDAIANLVNERGQVAGNSFINSTPNTITGVPTSDPFLWKNGTMLDLGTLGGTFGIANWLNNRGQVVGQSNLAGDMTWHPFLWERGELRDLGTLGGNDGLAMWLNDAGEVVGEADLRGSAVHHAFLWRNGVMTDLGSLGTDSAASAINSKGQVVGDYSRIGVTMPPFRHSFLWEKSGPMIDLNTLIPANSSLELVEANEINDRGEIVGVGVPAGLHCFPDFCGHAYLLIPCNGGDAEGCEDNPVDQTAVTQNNATIFTHGTTISTQGRKTPSEIVAAWRARLAQRYHIPGLAASPRD
jgi:probable HAF family extracellular repeat protein